MATEKKYLSYDMLSLYDSKMKEHVAGGDTEALQAAKTYAEELGDNYDASGSAATAESNANKYTDEQLATEKARAEAAEANLQEQINSVSNSANLEEIINSINGFNEYMTEHGEVAEGFRTAIDANTQAIETLEETLADGVTVSWNDLEDRPFGETITTVVSGSAVIPAGSTSLVTVIDGGVGYLVDKKRYIHDNAIFYGIIDGVTYYLEDVQSIKGAMTYFCTIDGCAINLSSAVDRKTGLYAIRASVNGNLGRDLTIELFYDLLETKTIDPKFLPEEAQSDWNQNDEKAPNYVKNRPFYYLQVEAPPITVIDYVIPTEYVKELSGYYWYNSKGIATDMKAPGAVDNYVYDVIYNGVTYHTVSSKVEEDTSDTYKTLIGDESFVNYPFYFEWYSKNGELDCHFSTGGEKTFTIIANVPAVAKPMDEKWLPESVAKTTLRSTTEESTKKFDVTVDDEGNLSTTDVETGETKVIGSGSGGGVTSWNDLEDKPFYDEAGFEIIFKSDFDLLYPTFSYSDDIGMIYEMEFYNTGIRLELGKKYAVKLDGTEYVLDTFVDGDRIYIGDSSIALKTEELPFALYQYSSYDSFYIDLRDQDTHSLEILQEGTIVHKLDSKYLDLPCYEIPKRKGRLVNEYEFNVEEPVEGQDMWSGTVDYPQIQRDQWYTVVLDGAEYDVKCIDGYVDYIGDDKFEKYPFYLYTNGNIGIANPTPHNMEIYELIPAEIVQLDPKFIPKEAQSNWYENDCNAVSYIRNRPFYEEVITTPIFECELDTRDGASYYSFPYDHYLASTNANGLVLEAGKLYCVKYDGLDYYVTATYNKSRWYDEDIIWLAYVDLQSESEFGLPFSIGYDALRGGRMEYTCTTRDIHKVEISLVTDSVVHKIEPKYLTQPDWDEEDVNSAAYIHNKTHYIEKNRTTLADVKKIPMGSSILGSAYNYEHRVNDDCFMNGNSPMFVLEVGRKYEVTFNDEVYELIGKQSEQYDSIVYIGNPLPVPSMFNATGEGTDLLFAISQSSNGPITLYVKNPWGNVNIKIVTEYPVVHTLDPKFLPMDDITTAVLSALPTWTGGSY